jgi:Zn-dependent metalloprotease
MKRWSFLVVVLSLVSQSAMLAQQDPASGEELHIGATTIDSIREWDANIGGMVQTRDLVVHVTFDDPVLQDRRHETLVQYYQGVRVYGGSLSRQTLRGVTVSIMGTLLTGIALDPVPGLSTDQTLAVMRDVSGGIPVGTDVPELIIIRTLSATYALSYRAMMSNGKTYYVDASSGEVLWTVAEVKTQSAVGVATGALGDRKKITTMATAGTFRTHDELRPAPIRTYDTEGDHGAFSRIDREGLAFDSDFPTDSDNTWTNPAVVDAHVHTGWTQDYLYKQQGWKGVDNRNSPIMNVVHSGYKNNAHFRPLSSDGRGIFAYGVTDAGIPITALDVVAHEVMHGVTSAALRQRTGDGLGDSLRWYPPGPTSVTYNGRSYSCSWTTFDGYPPACSNGRWLTVSNHAGAINEAFSDVIGTATEFYFHAKGPGVLHGDYKNGEDVVGFGPIRALDDPRSMARAGVRFPDHYARTFQWIVINVGGRLVPSRYWIIIDGELIYVGGFWDNGGVHVNATVLGHAFYLAIEGGRNHTSARTVQGVGFANKHQIEQAFFRAMTVLMPNEPSMPMAASVTVQAAVDLFGANSTAARAIREAMQAVGLR